MRLLPSVIPESLQSSRRSPGVPLVPWLGRAEAPLPPGSFAGAILLCGSVPLGSRDLRDRGWDGGFPGWLSDAGASWFLSSENAARRLVSLQNMRGGWVLTAAPGPADLAEGRSQRLGELESGAGPAWSPSPRKAAGTSSPALQGAGPGRGGEGTVFPCAAGGNAHSGSLPTAFSPAG